MIRINKIALSAYATILLSGTAAHAQTVDFSKGFPKGSPLAINQTQNTGAEWDANPGNSLVLTSGDIVASAIPQQTISVFNATPLDVTAFKTIFTFRLSAPKGQVGSGFTFTIHNAPQGNAAIGKPNSGLGFAGIAKSVAVKFDNIQDPGDPSNNCIGLFTGGTAPLGGIDLNKTGINLSSGDLMQAEIAYFDKVLYVYLYDTQTGAYTQQQFKIDLPSTIASNAAFVGFTGSTISQSSRQEILNWYFSSAATVSGLSVDKYLIPGGTLGNGTVTMSGPVLQDTVVKLSSANPAAFVPDSVVIPAGQQSVDFSIKTVPVANLTRGLITANVDNVTLTANYSVRPIQLDGASIQNDYVAEGTTSSAVLTLEAPAAPGPIIVNLTSNNPAVASVPVTVIFPAGSTTATIPIYTGSVDVNTPVLFTATTNGASRTTTLTVRPLRPIGLSLTVSTVSGGSALQGTVELEAPAPKGGRVVQLASANAAVAGVPTLVTVPEGATTQVFPIATAAVKANTTVILSATIGNASVYTSLTISSK
jgi:CTP:molybdopterin cytidylyltransferase MocA